ncbi:hypothetical protein, partial [Pseudomonas aeruginosa]|uniref:hypothetical protein n=2 Tax=Pseudomonas aeruginosa TaxID=287 RepID=UPI001CA4A6C1
MSLEKKDAILFGDGDELPSNHSNNPHMNDLIAGLGRRQVLAGGRGRRSGRSCGGCSSGGWATRRRHRTGWHLLSPGS